MTAARYDRQIRLAEVGAPGQERLARARAEVRGRDGHMVELAYLERAGMGAVTLVPERAPEDFVHAAHFRFPESREVAAGAWRALRKIRAALGVSGT